MACPGPDRRPDPPSGRRRRRPWPDLRGHGPGRAGTRTRTRSGGNAMNRDHPTQPEYQARVQEVLDRPELYGLTLEEAEAQAEADMEGETYADRWQAWAESREPEPELEAGLDDA